ncbi:hypothetical protein GCM10010347_58890 [Streptomyces cirratus]|uniref:DUF3040 domain-containing protein n=1 Tax=Streptomyces cirratus TaxID=68187 RepID=A0ABQ3F470_9ACTN|nr:hypothetical protein GCM10010347_58890 [Streptomyces cirratus]
MPLAKPDTTERARTAEQLDRAETLTSDQRLLRVLLDDDQTEFERALRERLVAHRESVGPDPAARGLLPLGVVTLAALACLAHGLAAGHPIRLSASSAAERPATAVNGRRARTDPLPR